MDASLDRIDRERGVSGAEDGKAAKLQRERVRWIGVALASYALDALFLFLYVLAGTLPAVVPLAYGLGALAICSASYAYFSTDWSRRFQASSASTFEMVVAMLLQVMVVWLAPQIAFPYLANLFTVLAFGVLQLSVRQFALVWLVGTAGAGIAMAAHAERLAIPASGGFELLLSWLYFASVLGRTIFLSVVAQGMRRKLDDSRRRLSAALGQVQQLAIRDELTGAYNRRHVMGRLHEELSRFERTGQVFCIALFDLDHFKAINDGHGHGAGDAVLKAFSRLADETTRNTDLFGRYGGEEFLLILPATSQALALQAVERLRSRMRASDWAAIAPGLDVTVSVGVAESHKGATAEALLNEADIALYEAKRGGRDRVVAAAGKGTTCPEAAIERQA